MHILTEYRLECWFLWKGNLQKKDNKKGHLATKYQPVYHSLPKREFMEPYKFKFHNL